ncbi:hypothetical protein WJX73_001888 [Symbiochloris irregularis]|uniref:Fatty acid hydroxylase domain-containing protein n=1 Tax=Symbiochloris irregularis TaxID=706552 RepID=A0AAW1NIX9_9CHLO
MDIGMELTYLAVGVVGGAMVGVGNYVTERCGFHLCHWLKERQLVSRLSRTRCSELCAHPASNACTVGLPYVILYWSVARSWGGADGFGRKMSLDIDLTYICLFTWAAMVVHDAWFYLVHSGFHWHKPLYTKFHALHHSNGACISALGTAYGEAVDVGLCFVAFHAILFWVLKGLPSWNLPAVVVLISFEVATNVTGHCGYQLPLWLHALVTGGVGLTPFAATSRTHYIHHLDPRVNKGLYFTWWDRLAGTYADEHVLCLKARQGGPAPSCEQVGYARPVDSIVH